MTKQQIGAELKRLRLEQGLTQPQVAKASDQRTQHIHAMETGALNLTLDRLEKVAAALGVTVALVPAEKSMLISEPEQKACLLGEDSAGWDI